MSVITLLIGYFAAKGHFAHVIIKVHLDKMLSMRTGRRNTVRASDLGSSIIREACRNKKWILDTNKDDTPLTEASKHLEPFGSNEYADGVNYSSWKNFRLGKFCSLCVFKAYCKCLEIEWYKVVDWEAINDNKLLAIDISFTSLNCLKLSSPFKWIKGSNSNSKYNLTKEGILDITAAANSDQHSSKDSAPLISYPVVGNFEAIVQVNFYSEVNFQRAGFGIRSTSKNFNYLRIYLLEFERVEVSKNSFNESHVPKLQVYKSKTVHFKITRYDDYFTLSYSANRKDWVDLLFKHRYTVISQDAELYFYVLSAHTTRKANAEFSNFTIKLPKLEFLRVIGSVIRNS